MELEDSRVFAMIESGNIFLMLGSFRKGIEQFQQALKLCPENIFARYGLASGPLALSKEYINAGAFVRAASLLEEASEIAKSCTISAGKSCIWKLYGDIQLTYAKCFPWMEEGRMIENDKEAFTTSFLSWKRTCYLAAVCASNSYQRALHLTPWLANVYTDVAIAMDMICALKESYKSDSNSCNWFSLSQMGNALDAVQELEDLKGEGLIDVEGLQIYAISLWQHGKNELALSAARDLAKLVSVVGESAGPSVSLICRLFYYIFGLDSAVNSILKMPKALFRSTEVSFIISAIDALDQNNCLESVVSSSRSCLSSHEEIMEMHLLIAMSKLVKQVSIDFIDMQSGVGQLKKALHIYPNSTPIRNLLGYFLLSRKQWDSIHVANKCHGIVPYDSLNKGDLRLGPEIYGAEALCHVHATTDNYINLEEEYTRCLNLQTDYPVGWMCLKFIESRYDLQDEVNSFYEGFRGDVNGSEGSQNMWMAVYNLLLGLISAWAQDLVHA
ncbi:hypothetical protein Ancab_036860 [Ancistrocladus abbreviatus]